MCVASTSKVRIADVRHRLFQPGVMAVTRRGAVSGTVPRSLGTISQ